MRYTEARLDQFTRDEVYRIFVSESLRLAPQNKGLVKSYMDMLKPPEEEPDGDEIAADIITRAGLRFEE